MPHPFDSAAEHAADPGMTRGEAEAVRAWGGSVKTINSAIGLSPRYFPEGDRTSMILGALRGGWLTHLDKVRDAGGQFVVEADRIVPMDTAIAAYLALRFTGMIEQPVDFFEEHINDRS